MAEDRDETAAAYALGIARGNARAAIEAQLAGDPGLQAQVKLWQQNLVALDLASPPEAPPDGLFEQILDAIDTGEEKLPGTLTQRAGTGVWTEMAPGVTFTVLFDDPLTKRRSMLIRAEPGAIYESHVHDQGYEECLVLEGDLTMGDLRLYPGDFHVAMKGSAHPVATTVSGCLLYLSTAL
jgi:anti-sigma factor ChrR (cupin superfamily)